MTQQCTYEFIKELYIHLTEVCDAFYYEDGSVIKEKDFSELLERSKALKDKLDDVLDSCAGDMYGKRVSTSEGSGKVISFGIGGKDNKQDGILVYEVLLDNSEKAEFFYDYEMKVIYENK